MGKKKIEKALNVVNTLKSNLEILQQKEVDTSFVKPLEASVKDLVKLKKEIETISEKLKVKNELLEQKKEDVAAKVKSAKSIIKTNLGKNKLKKTIKDDNAVDKTPEESKIKLKKPVKEDNPK